MSDGPESKSHTPFAIFNRIGNPAIKLLLQSPIHAPLSGRLALITVTGRKTGTTYTIPVLYEHEGDDVSIVVGWPERKRWWRNLRGGASVRMRIRGKERTGQATAHESAGGGVTVSVALDPV
jgi:deazaflavin-dependent oxidoreductase (nitroreductase family)